MRLLSHTFAAGLLATGMLSACKSTPAANGQPIRAVLYLMSRCPFAGEMLPALLDAKRQLGDQLDLELRYIGNSSDGESSSLYGASGGVGDKTQLCARQLGDDAGWLSFMACQARDLEQIPNNWGECARDAGLPPAAMHSCIDGPLGKALLESSYDMARTAGVTSSPTLLLDGETYVGGRRYSHLAKQICARLAGALPEACQHIPEPSALSVTLVASTPCNSPDCDTSRFERFLAFEFPGAVLRRVGASSAEGRSLSDRAGSSSAIIAIFDEHAPNEVQGFRKLGPHLRAVPELGYVFELGHPTGQVREPGRADEAGVSDERNQP